MNTRYPTIPLPPPDSPRWLKGGHLQTVYAKLLQRDPPPYRRELLPDSYGEDVTACDFTDAADPDAPLLLLFHGLEGSSRSHYAVELMHAARERGWHGAVAHFRSCGGVPSKRTYHSGDTRETAHILGLLSARYRTVYAAGVSLGGNALAKYLGEAGASALPKAAAAVSAPLDLQAGSRALESGLSRRLYAPYFLNTLMEKVPAAAYRPRTLGEFDNLYTAPMHGFADKDDYYAQSSAKPFLNRIAVPTLLLNARNDPFFPAHHLPRSDEVSPFVRLMQPENGGHCGFVTGSGRGTLQWLPQTLIAFFEACATGGF